MAKETFQPKNILITGGSGLIGTRLVKTLQKRGHQVSILSRNPEKVKNVNAFRWDLKKQEIDNNCLNGVDTIIHLAGANVGTKRWTEERKKIIVDSRVQSIKLLYKAVEKTETSIETVISPSGVGYYGDRGEEILTEESGNGAGFMAECCQKWEEAVQEGSRFGSRIVKFRIGVLLTKEGGALSDLEKPIRLFAGAPFGTGKQWMPWVHFDDLSEIFERAVENDEYQGVYNLCTPFPLRNETFTKIVAKKLHRPVWPIKVPEFVMNMLVGEMSTMVLMSDNVSSKKLTNQGYRFEFPKLEEALDEIHKNE